MPELQVVELFSGAGGAAIGLERAGLGHACLVEWDPDACATARASGLGPVVEGDLRRLNRRDRWASLWERMGRSHRVPAGLRQHRGAFALWSSFPCQAFSTAGKRLGASDPRNGWPWTVDAIDAVEPAWFLGENVTGLTLHSGRHCGDPALCPGCYFRGVILPQLEERFAWVGWWVLDAADYGVPQHRRRVIIVAGPGPVAPPAPTHGDPAAAAQGGLFGPRLKPWVSMGEALGIGPSADVVLECARNSENNPTQERPRPVSEPAPAIGGKGNQYLSRPAPTLSAGSHQSSNPNGRSIVSATQSLREGVLEALDRRRLTVQECAKLQAFPEDWRWAGNSSAQYRQVGNAVPPPLAEAVARQVLAADRLMQQEVRDAAK